MPAPRTATALLALAAAIGAALLYAVHTTAQTPGRGQGARAAAAAGVTTTASAEANEGRENMAEGRKPNRLIHARSPYLLQHAYNPVDWWPWGEEAFAEARRRDVPIFLSVGYATCHWCHVMERESFENEEIARLLNENFVPVKVDREERPDVDRVYMRAVMAMTGTGGWPMTVLLTPDGKPFFGGTYFPPEDRFGRPGLRTILERVAALWRTDRARLFEGAEQLARHVAAAPPSASAQIDAAVFDRAYRALEAAFDTRHGGFGPPPKFPRPHTLLLLLRLERRGGAPAARPMVERTLDAMARGGIRDHLGGGFHRYSTDARWLVPHFEKMLYDQALLARAYLEAALATGEPRHAAVARETLEYVLRDMTSPEGAFYTAEDADSEGEEGRFYLWTLEEVEQALGAQDAALFAEVYGLEPEGNYRDEASGRRTGRNILHLAREPAEVARAHGLAPEAFERRLAAMRRTLFERRSQRPRPLRDDKVLVDCNGLMIATLAFAARTLDEPRYLEHARRAATFVLEHMRAADGTLLHRYRDGEAGIVGFLDDWANLSWGLLELYESSGELRWLEEAVATAEGMIERFRDPERGWLRFEPRQHELPLGAPPEAYDGAVPSGNSVAAWTLARLGLVTGRERYRAVARGIVEAFAAELVAAPTGFVFLLVAFDQIERPGYEIVLAAGPGDEGELARMRRVLWRRYLPNSIVVERPAAPAELERLRRLAPRAAALAPTDGRPTAFICRGYHCELPAHGAAELAQRLGER